MRAALLAVFLALVGCTDRPRVPDGAMRYGECLSDCAPYKPIRWGAYHRGQATWAQTWCECGMSAISITDGGLTMPQGATIQLNGGAR